VNSGAPWRVSSSCSTSGTCCVNIATNPVSTTTSETFNDKFFF
jgi:hypothetical protein